MAVLFKDDFKGVQLITNEFAFQNPNDPKAIKSKDWEVTSGSLFRDNGQAWTGKLDRIKPNFDSSNGTNSAVFRMRTARKDFKDAEIKLKLKNEFLTSPGDMWDGCHIWFRYQEDNHLYYASVNRRDNKVLFKKKMPGGPSNDGTYYQIGSVKDFKVPYGQWQDIKITAKNTSTGVTMTMAINGNILVTAIDAGVGGPPILVAGRAGIRGDNAEMRFDDFQVATV